MDDPQMTDVLPVDGQVPEVNPDDAGGLPSVVDENTSNLDKFQLNDEFVTKNFKNGKLFGRFDSLEAVLNTLQSVETKYSNVMRDIKSDGTAPDTQVVAPEVSIQEVAQPIISKFVENDFNYDGMDAEIADLAQQSGKSVAEIKLAALEIKEQVTKAYSVVGGKEEYNAMLNWAKTTLDESKKADFHKALSNGMGEYAIKGLHADYTASLGGAQQPQRLQGDGSGNVGTRGYASLQEIGRDKAYLATQQGRSDTAAQEAHRRRMNLTPDAVIYGR